MPLSSLSKKTRRNRALIRLHAATGVILVVMAAVCWFVLREVIAAYAVVAHLVYMMDFFPLSFMEEKSLKTTKDACIIVAVIIGVLAAVLWAALNSTTIILMLMAS